jgi:hypothetical protein
MTYDVAENFSPMERNAMIRYALTIGTQAECATRCLMRPLKTSDLSAAFREWEQEHRSTIARYQKMAEEYEEGKTELPQALINYLGGDVSKKNLRSYCNGVIKQEREAIRNLRKGYMVNVSYAFCNKDLFAFHQSLHPRVTFGYSSSLHEICQFELTEEVRKAFLNSSLAGLPSFEDDWTHDFGYVYFDSVVKLLYEDLTIYKGERCVLSTLSHERMCELDLTDEELNDFLKFEKKEELNGGIYKKLKKMGH